MTKSKQRVRKLITTTAQGISFLYLCTSCHLPTFPTPSPESHASDFWRCDSPWHLSRPTVSLSRFSDVCAYPHPLGQRCIPGSSRRHFRMLRRASFSTVASWEACRRALNLTVSSPTLGDTVVACFLNPARPHFSHASSGMRSLLSGTDLLEAKKKTIPTYLFCKD